MTTWSKVDEELEVVRKESHALARVTTVVAVLIAVYHLLFVSGLLPQLGIFMMTQQHRAISLGSFLLLTYLTRSMKKGGKVNQLYWYDMLLILASLIPTGYYALFYSDVLDHAMAGFASTIEVVFAFLLMIAILEAGRRVVGWIMPVLVVFLIIHALFANYFPGIMFGCPISLTRLTATIYLGTNGIFGFPVWVASTIVITFILFSQLLLESGASKFFLNLALSLVGHMRGGPAKVAVVGSSLFATISGSPTANVASTGCITIPLMKNSGYSPEFAAGVEAVSSKGGQITPPVMGAVAFLMAEVTGYSYLAICIAAALPAVLYYISIFLQVDFRSAREGLKGIPRSELPSLTKTLKEGWQYLIPLIALVFLLIYLPYSAEMVAIYSMVILWLVTLFRKETRLGPKRLINGFESGASTALYAAIPCALAGVILASLSATGLGLRFSGQLINLAGGNMIVLVVLAAIASFIMGMGLNSLTIYLILAVLIAPSLVDMGVHVLAAHLFIIFWGNISFISPPVAVAAFVAAGIAGADPMKSGWQACRLGIVSFLVPFMFIWNPSLILVGSLPEVILSTVTALVGVAILASGVEGYLLGGGTIRWAPRAVILIGAVLLLLPGWQTDIVGLAVVLPVVLWRVRLARRAKRLSVDSPSAV